MNKNTIIGILLACVFALCIGIGAGTLMGRRSAGSETAHKKPVAEKVEAEDDESEDADAPEAAAPEAMAVAEAEEEAAASVDEREWKQAYLDYMAEREKNGNEFDMDFSFYETDLIYVNDDDIPELVIVGTCEAEGNQILTYTPGVGIDELQTSRLYFYYVEKGNLLINSDGNSGYYYDLCYEIKDGKWNMFAEGDNSYQVSEYGDWEQVEQNWGGVECSEEEYRKHLDDLVAGRSTRTVGVAVLWTDMQEYLNSDQENLDKYRYVEDSKEIHKYELCKTDESGWSASYDAMQRGGYLCRINSKEEYDHIVKQIYDEGMEKYVFYLGGGSVYQEPGHYRWKVYLSDFNYRYEASILNEDPELKDLWMAGEPSFKGTDLNGDEVEENQICFMFYGKENRFVLNDTPDDITPYYGNRVAYIIEYEH